MGSLRALLAGHLTRQTVRRRCGDDAQDILGGPDSGYLDRRGSGYATGYQESHANGRLAGCPLHRGRDTCSPAVLHEEMGEEVNILVFMHEGTYSDRVHGYGTLGSG